MERLNKNLNVNLKVRKAKIKKYNEVSRFYDTWEYSFFLGEHKSYENEKGFTEYYKIGNSYAPVNAVKELFIKNDFILEVKSNIYVFLDEMGYPLFHKRLLEFDN